jgi:hypothetical protein
VKRDPEWPRKPNKTTLQEPMVKAGDNAEESERESERQRMKNFLHGSLSMRRSDEHNNKRTDQTVEVSNQKIKRKLSIKSVGANCAE